MTSTAVWLSSAKPFEPAALAVGEQRLAGSAGCAGPGTADRFAGPDDREGPDIGSWHAVRPPREATEDARFAVAARAQQQDLVINSLADWVEAAKAAEHREAVRDKKEQVHPLALRLYRERYAYDEPWTAGVAH